MKARSLRRRSSRSGIPHAERSTPMPSPVPMAGSLQIAAALVFHLPGARLELSSPSGHRCSIGPMTDPRCTLHPAEFRELVVAAGDFQLLGTLLGFALVDEPTLTLTSSGIDMGHLGGGLYRVVGSETTSYAFTTSLPASQVDDLLTSLNTGARMRSRHPGHEDRVRSRHSGNPTRGRRSAVRQPRPRRRARRDAGGDQPLRRQGPRPLRSRRQSIGVGLPGRRDGAVDPLPRRDPFLTGSRSS